MEKINKAERVRCLPYKRKTLEVFFYATCYTEQALMYACAELSVIGKIAEANPQFL
jgi:hypothetical protein